MANREKQKNRENGYRYKGVCRSNKDWLNKKIKKKKICRVLETARKRYRGLWKLYTVL